MVVSIKFLLEFQRPGDREIEVGRCWPRVKESLPSIGVRTRICFHPIRPPRELYWYSRLVGWKQETRCSFASIRTTFRSLLNFILLFEYFWRVRSSRSGIIDNIRRNLVGEKVSITTNRDFSRIGEISRASKRECEWKEKMEKERKKEGLTRERDRSQNYLVAHCTCIAILPGATTSERLDQSFSTSAHHDIGLPYVHLRLLHPPTFSRPVVHLNPSLSHGGSPSVPSWSVGVALDQVKESIRPAYIRILHRSF